MRSVDPPFYAYRFKLKGSTKYINLMIPSFTDHGLSPEPGVYIDAEMIESIQYQDLHIPTLMRNQMGELAWTEITLEEIGNLFSNG